MPRLELGNSNIQTIRGLAFTRTVLERVRAVPGVRSAAIADSAPLGGGFLQALFREGDPVDSRLGTLTLTPPMTPDYFTTLRIPLREGRLLNALDRSGTTRVAVISY